MSNRQGNPKIINIVLIFVLIEFLTYFIVWIWEIIDAYKRSMLDSDMTKCVLYFLVLVCEVANTISVRICLWRREGNVE